jgi:hypothetical protein
MTIDRSGYTCESCDESPDSLHGPTYFFAIIKGLARRT